jgi:hypothetical protein
LVETLIVIPVIDGAGEAPGDAPADGLPEGAGDGLADGLGDGALDGEADGEAEGEPDDAAEADGAAEVAGGAACEDTAGLAVVAGGELAVGEVVVDAQAAASKDITNIRDRSIVDFLNFQIFIFNLHNSFYTTKNNNSEENVEKVIVNRPDK